MRQAGRPSPESNASSCPDAVAAWRVWSVPPTSPPSPVCPLGAKNAHPRPHHSTGPPACQARHPVLHAGGVSCVKPQGSAATENVRCVCAGREQGFHFTMSPSRLPPSCRLPLPIARFCALPRAAACGAAMVRPAPAQPTRGQFRCLVSRNFAKNAHGHSERQNGRTEEQWNRILSPCPRRCW